MIQTHILTAQPSENKSDALDRSSMAPHNWMGNAFYTYIWPEVHLLYINKVTTLNKVPIVTNAKC